MDVAERRPLDLGRGLERAREALGGQVSERDGDEQGEPAPEDGEPEREEQPDRAPRAEPRQPDEELVERVPAMGDDPPLPVTVEPGQRKPALRPGRSVSSG